MCFESFLQAFVPVASCRQQPHVHRFFVFERVDIGVLFSTQAIPANMYCVGCVVALRLDLGVFAVFRGTLLSPPFLTGLSPVRLPLFPPLPTISPSKPLHQFFSARTSTHRTVTTAPTRKACFQRVTAAEASPWSCGRSMRAAGRRMLSTRTLRRKPSNKWRRIRLLARCKGLDAVGGGRMCRCALGRLYGSA